VPIEIHTEWVDLDVRDVPLRWSEDNK